MAVGRTSVSSEFWKLNPAWTVPQRRHLHPIGPSSTSPSRSAAADEIGPALCAIRRAQESDREAGDVSPRPDVRLPSQPSAHHQPPPVLPLSTLLDLVGPLRCDCHRRRSRWLRGCVGCCSDRGKDDPAHSTARHRRRNELQPKFRRDRQGLLSERGRRTRRTHGTSRRSVFSMLRSSST